MFRNYFFTTDYTDLTDISRMLLTITRIFSDSTDESPVVFKNLCNTVFNCYENPFNPRNLWF